MKHRVMLLLATVAIAIPLAPANAEPPVYEPRVVPGVSKIVGSTPCTAESMFEAAGSRYDNAAPYDKCERLKIVFGPIWSKPGQNDVLIQPVTFEKPFYPGYLVRFKPDLVGVDGAAPRVKDVHLHHGTWLNTGYFRDVGAQLPVNPGRRYGWGPWIASGEEKTVAVWPKGYGLKIQPSDSWLFLHMIHNATAQTFPVWVTYDLDFIPEADAVAGGIKNTKGVWLDVGDCQDWTESGCEKDEFNPVFNVQRGRGSIEPGACVFPRENCAHQNTLAQVSTQQGIDKTPVFDEWTIPEAGTLTMMGGHLHFGGLRDDVYLVRETSGALDDACRVRAGSTPTWDARLIHISDALYWDHQRPASFDPFVLSNHIVGGNPASWDMVMTGVTKDLGWAVEVRKCDKLRLEGVYDSKYATWYEQMGIVMSWLAPGDTSGVDPFNDPVTIHKGLNGRAVNPPTTDGYALPGSEFGTCEPSAGVLCVRGTATHGRIETSADHWSCEFNGCPNVARAAADGPYFEEIHMGGFSFGQADFSVIPTVGVPTVPLGRSVTFVNADTADYMWHTVTRCANPCSGTTSASYPVPDGAYDDLVASTGKSQDQLIAERGPDDMDFDSGVIGIGSGANNKLEWRFTPTRTGTYTFFCRIHPSMRGAIRVVPAA